MKNEGSGIRNQGSERGGIEQLLRSAVPRVGDAELPEHDLWPAMRQRIAQEPAQKGVGVRAVPWFDWALAAGILVLMALSPDLIPVLLYHL